MILEVTSNPPFSDLFFNLSPRDCPLLLHLFITLPAASLFSFSSSSEGCSLGQALKDMKLCCNIKY